MNNLTKVIVLLLVLLVGCREELPDEPNCVADVNCGQGHFELIFENDADADVIFEWNDGIFNVVYDANNCTEAAKVFFDCMLPYLNEHIEEKARELKFD